ncbi:hypothetical protein ACFW1M_10700 [Streptomyces inhibens]|uniref:hypothetical protein n=1 Tax=Streptomyces inhibens TaxID=2293571 RepID=UPI003695095C
MKKLRAAVVTIVAAASLAVVVPSTAQAADECKSGGQAYICEYGISSHNLSNGTKQVFTVAPDHSVVTRWTDTDGAWSRWASLGGHALSKIGFRVKSADEFTIVTHGTDGFPWGRERDRNGNWGPWSQLDIG